MGTPAEPVLVVEDNSDAVLALAEFLAVHGYEIATARNGLDALHYLRRTEGAACLVLLDLDMPVMDGRTFLRAKSADPVFAAIPVVVYSAFGGKSLPPEITYVQKGSTEPSTLLDVIERTCRKPA